MAPELNPRLEQAMRAHSGRIITTTITGQDRVSLHRAACQFIKASDLVRLTGGAVGAKAASYARYNLDRLESK